MDTIQNYWNRYSNLQKIKHDIIKYYLQGWFPKLGSWSSRILYFDTHAGRGRHATGDAGSPLVVLETFLAHSYRDKILKNCEVIFFFIELNDDNCKQLREEIGKLGKLPDGIKVEIHTCDSYEFLEQIIESLKQDQKVIAPSFVFIDPFGFKVPGRIIKKLMSFDQVELFINIIWRELYMALSQPQRMKETIDEIFDTKDWINIFDVSDYNKCADEVAKYYCDLANARWFTHIKMLGYNDAIRYFLLHLTNADAGRDLMKDCMWRVCPEGGFYARKKDDPRQGLLITPEPNLKPLEEWVLYELRLSQQTWQDLLAKNKSSLYLDKHLNLVIRELKKNSKINGINCKRFTPSNNPTLIINN